MDPFTQNLLQRLDKRAAALGITDTSKFPYSDFNHDAETTPCTKKSPAKKVSASGGTYTKSPKKNPNATFTVAPKNTSRSSSGTRVDTQQKQSHASGKDVDVAVEINITTASNVQVEVEVAECEVDSTGKITRKVDNGQDSSEAKGLIRDSSRNQLQRLGTLYSETQDLSSPVHRTEGRFHEDIASGKENARPKPKLAKLAMLADSINNWEDDTSHPDIKHHRETIHDAQLKDKSPNKESSSKLSPVKKYAAPKPPKSILSPARGRALDNEKAQTKTLKWDQKVMDALESQGFQKRESSCKLVYDYKDQTKQHKEKQESESNEKALVPLKKTRAPEIPNAARERAVVQQPPKTVANKPEISKGLVSGRAAMFEHTKSSQSVVKAQKDPTEMSVKDRLAIFEKNKGQALVPKAAFGISPSIRQITGESASAGPKNVRSCLPIQGAGIGTIQQTTMPHRQKIDSHNKVQISESNATGKAIKHTLAALMSNNTTISESQIAVETKRQRQQEMEMLLNRFATPTDMSSDSAATKPIPSAPPMPPEGYLTLSAKKPSRKEDANVIGHKRRSGEDNISPEVRTALGDVKRIRVAVPKSGSLYPALSDLETATTESEGDDYTTASVSGEESERNQTHYQDCYDEEEQEYDEQDETEEGTAIDEDDDSYMYSDEDDDESYTGICDVSLGQEIMQAVTQKAGRVSHGGRRQSQVRKVEQTEDIKQQQRQSTQSCNTSSEISEILGDMDEYLDEALDADNGEEYDTPTKSSVSSNSFSYKKNPRRSQCQKIDEESNEEEKKDPEKPLPNRQNNNINEDYSSPVKSELKINPSDDNNMVTLVHTVSFFRKQQNLNSKTPTPIKPKFVRSPVNTQRANDDTFSEESDDDSSTTTTTTSDQIQSQVQEKLKNLLAEACKQQTIMSQASQALNLCAATIEFSGSTESVEAERHLLVATHRRQAILDEVQRLKVEGCLRPIGAPTDKGHLTVKEITLPLKQDYTRRLASESISGHHLICLLKYNETVLSTQTIPTLPGLHSVRFPDVLKLSNVYADFKITIEIYGMTAQREVLPHEIKYHIAMNKKGSNKLHTPKGVKSNSRLIKPPVESPAGPQIVRTPALVQYGFIIFSLKESKRVNWTLNPVSGVSPLEGTVHMKVNCELSVSVNHRGFLTMFEDISGFGAWHIRWCHLNASVINYWKYPDDEKCKPPMGSIDLQRCCTQKVGVAPREVSTRAHTLLLEFRRPAQPDDVESLVLVRQGDTTIHRLLLSADSKEECVKWCSQLNKALTTLKAWGKINNRAS